MSILTMMDDLLRDRRALYRMAVEQQRPARLLGALLLIFFLTTALYGLVMGGFRWLHPDYVFSDFQIRSLGQTPSFEGKVAGVDAERNSVYTTRTGLPPMRDAAIAFNISQPTEPYVVVETGERKGYGAIVLAPGSRLREEGAWRLPLLVALKVPLVFLATLLVCCLPLYVFNLALDAGLRFVPVMTLMGFALASTGVMLAVFAPVAALFTVVTGGYHFMKTLHVLVFAVAGMLGVKVLGEGLRHMAGTPSRRFRSLVAVWLLTYCFVGGQVAWTLKPFLGTPYLPATPPFRVETGNLYVSVLGSLSKMTERR